MKEFGIIFEVLKIALVIIYIIGFLNKALNRRNYNRIVCILCLFLLLVSSIKLSLLPTLLMGLMLHIQTGSERKSRDVKRKTIIQSITKAEGFNYVDKINYIYFMLRGNTKSKSKSRV